MHDLIWTELYSERQMSLFGLNNGILPSSLSCCVVTYYLLMMQRQLWQFYFNLLQGAMDPKNFVLKKLERKTGYLEVIPGKYIKQNATMALCLLMAILF